MCYYILFIIYYIYAILINIILISYYLLLYIISIFYWPKTGTEIKSPWEPELQSFFSLSTVYLV